MPFYDARRSQVMLDLASKMLKWQQWILAIGPHPKSEVNVVDGHEFLRAQRSANISSVYQL